MTFDLSRQHEVTDQPRNSTGHRFLSTYSDDEIRQGIAEMDPARRRRSIERHLPGGAMAKPFTSVEAALEANAANFTVEKFPLIAVLPPAFEGGEPQAVEVPGKVGITRTDTSQVLGVAGENYGLIQNLEAFGAASVLAAEGKLDIHSVQVIDNGARVRISGLIGESTIEQLGKGPDVLAHYAMFEAAHDGIHSVLGALDTLRLACFNGMTVRTKETVFKVSHTSRAADRNAEAQKLLLDLQQAAVAETEIFSKMAQSRMSLAEFKTFSADLIDGIRGEVAESDSDRRKNKRAKDLAELEDYFQNGDGNVGISEYDAYNAVTDFITPRREAMKDAAQFAKKFESATTGFNQRVKARALRLLTK